MRAHWHHARWLCSRYFIRYSPRMIQAFSRLCVSTILALCVSGCVIVSGNINPFSGSTEPLVEHEVSGSGGDKIVLLDISGEITSQSSSSAFGLQTIESTLARTEAALQLARDDDDVRAVILRINSPGGGVTASDVLYQQIRRYRDATSTPVIAAIDDVGASGAYYAALAADEIVAHPTSVVGSIGVVMQGMNFTGLMKKLGVETQTVKTGEMKDIGSPFEKMSDDERRVLQSVIDDMYDRFLGLVRKNRPQLSAEMSQKITDGRIFSAKQALDGGLIDRIEYLEDTIEHVKRSAGLGEATVIVYRQANDYVRGIHSRLGTTPNQSGVLNIGAAVAPRSPRLLYQWIP